MANSCSHSVQETHDPNFPGLSELAFNTGGVEQGVVGERGGKFQQAG